MDWGIILGIVGVFGIPLALAILGLTMAATTPGEFRFVRGCFYVAAAISTVTIFMSLWNYSEGSEIMRVLSAAIAGAVIFGGIAIALDWVDRKQFPEAAGDKKPTSQAAPILFNCQRATLPATVPASGHVATMDIMSKLETGGSRPLFLGSRHGDPGERWKWFESDRELGGVSRCDITNYADFPIFNVAMTFKEEFLESISSKDNPGSISSGQIVDTQERLVVITNMDPKGTFSFYAYSQSKYFVRISLPSEVTYLKAGSETREVAQLLPPGMGSGMGFVPITIKDTVAPKSPPAPPPPTPSQPDKPRKK